MRSGIKIDFAAGHISTKNDKLIFEIFLSSNIIYINNEVLSQEERINLPNKVIHTVTDINKWASRHANMEGERHRHGVPRSEWIKDPNDPSKVIVTLTAQITGEKPRRMMGK